MEMPDRKRLVQTAMGEMPADLVIEDGILVDVYTGRVTLGRSVALSGVFIA